MQEQHDDLIHNPAPTNQANEAAPVARQGVPIPVSRPIATYLILGLIAGVFLLEMIIDQTSETRRNWLIEAGLLWPFGILNGEYHRLFTALFLHAGIAHAALNGYALFIYGKLVEGFFGHVRFLLVYFIAGLVGNIAELFILQTALGASGAIFGIFGAHMVFLYLNRQAFGTRGSQELRSLVMLALVNLGIGVFSQVTPGAIKIGLAAHVGGFVAGAILAWFIAPRYALVGDSSVSQGYRVSDSVPTRQVWMVSGVAIAVVIVSFVISLTVMRQAFLQ
jgi:membrane associated rhomboid family serine protease